MNTVYRNRAMFLAHNGQERVNVHVTCTRHFREDLSDLNSLELTSVGEAPSLVTEMLMALQLVLNFSFLVRKCPYQNYNNVLSHYYFQISKTRLQ